jgi:hypothetical protein
MSTLTRNILDIFKSKASVRRERENKNHVKPSRRPVQAKPGFSIVFKRKVVDQSINEISISSPVFQLFPETPRSIKYVPQVVSLTPRIIQLPTEEIESKEIVDETLTQDVAPNVHVQIESKEIVEELPKQSEEVDKVYDTAQVDNLLYDFNEQDVYGSMGQSTDYKVSSTYDVLRVLNVYKNQATIFFPDTYRSTANSDLYDLLDLFSTFDFFKSFSSQIEIYCDSSEVDQWASNPLYMDDAVQQDLKEIGHLVDSLCVDNGYSSGVNNEEALKFLRSSIKVLNLFDPIDQVSTEPNLVESETAKDKIYDIVFDKDQIQQQINLLHTEIIEEYTSTVNERKLDKIKNKQKALERLFNFEFDAESSDCYHYLKFIDHYKTSIHVTKTQGESYMSL